MNLLEHFQRNLDDSKKALGIQLLNKPWNTDLQALCKHVPKALYDRFTALQQDVLIRLDRIDNKTALHNRLQGSYFKIDVGGKEFRDRRHRPRLRFSTFEC